MAIILRSPDYYDGDIDTKRLIFLAGPIQGAPNWQEEAIAFLSGKLSNKYIVASPRSLRPVDEYYGQADWEHYHLERADVVLFWLPRPLRLAFKERLHVLFLGIPSRPYAQTTRFEFGWLTCYCRYLSDRKKLLVGIEPGFSNERYIRHTIKNKFFSRAMVLEEELVPTLQRAIAALEA